MGTRLFHTLIALALFAACATGTDLTSSVDDETNGADGGANPTGGGGGTKADTTSSGMPMGGMPGTGGSPAGMPGPTCNPPNHLCGGICVDNTPATGCTNSVDCTPCQAVLNGTSICSPTGDCDVTCNAPYQKNGLTCMCPTACCTDAECGGSTCVNGTCTTPPSCDLALCLIICFAASQSPGICVGDQCVCL